MNPRALRHELLENCQVGCLQPVEYRVGHVSGGIAVHDKSSCYMFRFIPVVFHIIVLDDLAAISYA